MNKNPIITIGITAFNDWKYLMKAIESVIQQTSNNWKGVLILDGECDKKTKKIFDNFYHSHFKKYSFTENQGPPKTREKAIELCETEWYYHLDGDDLLPVNSIKLIIKAINDNPNADFVYGNCEHFSRSKSMTREPIEDTEYLSYGPLFNTQSPIKKNLFYRLNGFDKNKNLIMNFDWDFWITVFENKIKGIRIDSTIYKRRNRKNNIGNRKIHLGPKSVDYIVKKHPLYFNTTNRINIAKFNVYEKLARYYKAQGNRNLAYEWAKKAVELGDSHEGLENIFTEKNMSIARYKLRRFARYCTILINKFFK